MDLPITLQPEELRGGFVSLIDAMGSDQRVLQAARVSTGSAPSKGEKADRGLIRYLYKNKHFSPFEQCKFTFHIKMPIFVMRQFIRHRTWAVNEYSMRYSEPIDECFIPSNEEWREQGITNHQGSGGAISKISGNLFTGVVNGLIRESKKAYYNLLESGVAKEQARIVVPVAQFTEIYASVDLRNLYHFLELRLHPHAQKEIRDYAQAIYSILLQLPQFKWSNEIFDEMKNLNYTLSELLGNKVEPIEIEKMLFKAIKEKQSANE